MLSTIGVQVQGWNWIKCERNRSRYKSILKKPTRIKIKIDPRNDRKTKCCSSDYTVTAIITRMEMHEELWSIRKYFIRIVFWRKIKLFYEGLYFRIKSFSINKYYWIKIRFDINLFLIKYCLMNYFQPLLSSFGWNVFHPKYFSFQKNEQHLG